MDGIRVGRWQWPLVEGLGTRRGDKIIKTSKGWYQDIEVICDSPKICLTLLSCFSSPRGSSTWLSNSFCPQTCRRSPNSSTRVKAWTRQPLGISWVGGELPSQDEEARWRLCPAWPLSATLLDDPWETTGRCWDWPWSHTVVGWMGRTPWRMSFGVWLRLAVWATCPSICTGVSLPRQDWCPCILAPCWVEGMGKLGGSQVHVVTPQGIQTEQGQSSLLIFSLCPLPGTPQTFRSSKLLWHVTSLPTSTWCRH